MDQKEEVNQSFWRRFISGGAVPPFLLLGVLFVLPILVVPGSSLSSEVQKKFLFSLVILLAFIFWLSGRLLDGSFVFPKGLITVVALVVLLTLAVSTLLSPVKSVSLAGLGYEFGTFLSLASLLILFFLSSIIFQNIGRVFRLAVLLTLSFLIVSTVWLLHLFFGFNWFGLIGPTSTLIGGWNDFGIFAGLIALVTLVLLESAFFIKKVKLLLAVIFLIALGVLLVVNYSLIWWALAVFSLAIFLQSFRGLTFEPKRFLRLPLAVFLLSISLAVWGAEGSAFDRFVDRFVPTPLEVRPSWDGTWQVVKLALSEDPIWGVGPNRFVSVWLRTRPPEVNQGVFWNVDFGSGVGHLPTLLVTSGLAGAFFWLIFLGIFIFYGLKAIVKIPRSHELYPAVFASFWAALFLWFFFIAYLPLSFITALTFVLTGVFLALLVRVELIKNINFSSIGNPTRGFVAILVVLILMIFSVSAVYLVSVKWQASAYFEKGFSVFAETADPLAAEEFLTKATRLDGRDLYFRETATVLTFRLRQELSEPDLDQEAIRSRFIATYGRVLETAASAKEADPTNYLNYLTTAAAYGVSIVLGNIDAYDLAKNEYQEAARLNPTSPIIPHRLAQLELLVGNQEKAKESLGAALILKPNFVPALLLFSQIEAGEGNFDGAISLAERAKDYEPNSLDALFQLGVLYYRNNDWDEAIGVLEKAVSLQPNYANAKYFLGLVYERVDRQKEAIKIFEELSLTNPDEENIKRIISNLKAGRAALAGLPEPTFNQAGSFDQEAFGQ